MMLSFGGGYVLKEFAVSINPQCSPFGIRKAEQYGIFRNFTKFPTPTFKSQLEAPTRIDHQLPQIKRTVGDVSTDSMCAVVTGANKGIGHEIVRRLALEGVTVVLTARDEKRGSDAVSLLVKSGLENVVFHQLDVRDQSSADSLAKYVQTQFGKLDILVNNAGASGVVVDEEGLRALNIDPVTWLSGKATNMVQGVMQQPYETAVECLDTNYYGCKRVTEALLPLLKLSKSGARIVSVSSLRSELKRIPNEQLRRELADLKNLTEEKVDKMVENFLHDLKQVMLEENGWPLMLPSYSISKVAVNAYTRVLAKRHPNMFINCVHPGYVNTDINWHTGTMNVEDGAKGPVMLALLSDGEFTGCYFDQTRMAEF
ncbi:hypothetical protein MKW98_024969 [Papaver atlanticum]|uniref:Uncharacterized protein n=1 Tax=Papaver atlanticum TaxID=357466 RepID=A0AAD4T209_9MAGN|nr:hypothetical protein MKW98_024969 [Papaver atlanticum]